MFTSSVSILALFFINFTLSLREEFYATYEVVDGGSRCNSAISRFDKGIKCCLDSDNDGHVDECTPRDSNGNCFIDYQFTDNTFTEDYETAKQTCLNRGSGYRLCTITELSSTICTTGLGAECLGNYFETWSSQGCIPIFETYRASDNSDGAQSGIGGTAAVRCCGLNSGCDSESAASGSQTCYYELAGLTATTQDQISYTQATSICENDNRRICNIGRVKNDNVCVNSGCSGNSYYVWARENTFSLTTWAPSFSPTSTPSQPPTTTPTDAPTNVPTNSPTDSPTESPTYSPTDTPTNSPTLSPTYSPTYGPVETPVVPWGQFDADASVMPSDVTTWDNAFRFKETSLDTFGILLEDGIDIRPDSNGKPAFLFAKSGVYKIEFRVAVTGTKCAQRLQLRPANALSTGFYVGQSSIIQSSSPNNGLTNTISVSFIALINDASQLYVIYQQRESLYDAEDCYPSENRYDSVITYIYG